MSKTTHRDADDYSLSRVPWSARYHWFLIAVQRFGQLSALSQFLIGATLGFGMSFWNAFLAFTFGAVILELVTIFTGVIGMKQGMSTSVVTRWTGFGTVGSAIIGLAIGVSAVGWFGIQSGVSADGLALIMPFLPSWAWSLIFGILITLVVVRGIGSMQWIANITVPIFMALVGWAVISELSSHAISDMIAAASAGEPISLVAGTTIVAGSFMVGAVICPDMSRFNRTIGDVVKQTILGFTLGEYVIGMSGVLLAHALKTADITQIIISSVGWVGVLIIVLGTFKINDWNLYSSGLGVVNFVDTIFGRKVNRAVVTGILGVVGSLLAAVGILGKLVGFLTVLGVAFPPTAGIMIAEYYFVKKWRNDLDSTQGDEFPRTAPRFVPVTLIIWAAASVGAYFLPWGIPSINAVASAFLLYLILGKLGLIRGYGTHHVNSSDKTDTNTHHLEGQV